MTGKTTERIQLMKTLFALVAAAALLSACVTPRDGGTTKIIGGQRSHYSNWSTISKDAIRINLGDLGDYFVNKTEQRIRNNRILVQRASFEYGQGYLYIQYNSGPRNFFNQKTRGYYSDETYLPNLVRKQLGKHNSTITVEQIVEVQRGTSLAGHAMQYVVNETGARCMAATIGFLSLGTKAHPTEQLFDTLVYLRDCTNGYDLDHLVGWARSVKIVPEGYNSRLSGV